MTKYLTKDFSGWHSNTGLEHVC